MMQLKQDNNQSLEPRIDRHQNPGSLAVQAEAVWSREQWELLERGVAKNLLSAEIGESRQIGSRWGRKVLKAYSSSFYAVTRFLPREKRGDVEMVYAAVRYPDEIVDTFDLPVSEKRTALDQWLQLYESSAHLPTIQDAVATGIPVTIAGFRDVVRRHDVPERHYVDFIEAMRSDIAPQVFSDWTDLIERYVYGSATVVGFFLAHIYGTSSGHTLDESLRGARSLAIALQLTHFARDVADDAARSRCYLPADQVDMSGNAIWPLILAGDPEAIAEAKMRLAEEAALWFDRAANDIEAFHPDSRVAIESCHRLYSTLNTRVLQSESPFDRESLSLWNKLSVLPRSKYWRLPLSIALDR